MQEGGFSFSFGVDAMADNQVLLQYESGLLIPFNFALFLILWGLVFAIVMDPYLKKWQRSILLAVSVVVASLILQGQLDTYFGIFKISRLGRILLAAYGYQMRPLVVAMFIRLLDQENKKKWIWVLVIINALLYATAPFSGITFSFTEDLHFVRGPLGYSCYVISLALLLCLLGLSIFKYGRTKRWETVTPIGIVVLILGAVAMDYIVSDAQWISYLTISMVCSCVFFYIWIHVQFAREHDRALRAEQEVQFKIAQVQPHFLYSVLSTIQSLCMTNPDKAREVTERFGTYLQQNNDSLNVDQLIPFSKELEHTKTYVELEMERFPNFRIEYDVKEEDFLVPALSLQPLVENAIRQDERVREAGLIRVSASREGDNYEIIVWDNGTGFQNGSAHVSDPLHIDLKNVRERVMSMCGGTMVMETFPTDGTIVTIKIPVKQSKTS